MRIDGQLRVDPSVQDIWISIDTDTKDFLEQHGTLCWESGGRVGGCITASINKEHRNLVKQVPELDSFVVVGSDESAIFVMRPNDARVFILDSFLKRVDVSGTIYETIADAAGLS